jgi:hypothetical protein
LREVLRSIRAAVELLLSLGANPNAVSWSSESCGVIGRSMLGWPTQKRDDARKEENEKLYAAIIEGKKSLVAAGGMKDVDPIDEFGFQGTDPKNFRSV